MTADRLPVIVDTDIGNDIDDAVCLAYLLAQPRCELLGITTVTADPIARARLADVLCRNAGRSRRADPPGRRRPAHRSGPAATATAGDCARALAPPRVLPRARCGRLPQPGHPRATRRGDAADHRPADQRGAAVRARAGPPAAVAVPRDDGREVPGRPGHARMEHALRPARRPPGVRGSGPRPARGGAGRHAPRPAAGRRVPPAVRGAGPAPGGGHGRVVVRHPDRRGLQRPARGRNAFRARAVRLRGRRDPRRGRGRAVGRAHRLASRRGQRTRIRSPSPFGPTPSSTTTSPSSRERAVRVAPTLRCGAVDRVLPGPRIVGGDAAGSATSVRGDQHRWDHRHMLEPHRADHRLPGARIPAVSAGGRAPRSARRRAVRRRPATCPAASCCRGWPTCRCRR